MQLLTDEMPLLLKSQSPADGIRSLAEMEVTKAD